MQSLIGKTIQIDNNMWDDHMVSYDVIDEVRYPTSTKMKLVLRDKHGTIDTRYVCSHQVDVV